MDKQCRLCNIEKPLSAFHKSRRHQAGVKNECALCTNDYLKKHYHKNKAKTKLSRRRQYYFLKYGITYSDYLKLYQSKKGLCDICGNLYKAVGTAPHKDMLIVDHCHKTNKIRGLLCQKCNQGLGMFKDDIDILVDAQYYLLTFEGRNK